MPLTPEALQAICDNWTGNRALDLRGIPVADLDEADAVRREVYADVAARRVPGVRESDVRDLA